MGRTIMCCVLLSVLSTTSHAQAIELRGTVRDNASHQPIAGAVVTLFDSANAVLGRFLTGERGQYRVPMANPVRHVRVQRLGFKPQELQIPAAVDSVEQLDVEMVALPSLLDPVRVVVDKRCPRRDDGERAIALLQQARSGLLTLVVARNSNPGTVVRLGFRRIEDGRPDRIVSQDVRIDTVLQTAVSFASARSGADFVRLGFRDDSLMGRTYGPDADILLDDDFAAGYCFRIMDAERDRPNQIGLGFSPASRQQRRVDIDGALWIDTVARALVDIDYRYVGLGSADAMHPGGNTHFHEMSNGIVLVDRWYIRSPATMTFAIGGSTRVVLAPDRMIESGGEVIRASWPDGLTWQASLGKLSIHATTSDQQPAAGAIVGLLNTDYRGIVDTSGNVVLADLFPGPYTVVVADRRLPEIDLARSRLTFEAKRDSTITRTLVVKTLNEYTVDRCKDDRRMLGRAVLIVGRAADEGGQAAINAQATYGLAGTDGAYRFNIADDGIFALCLDAKGRRNPAEVRVHAPDHFEGRAVAELSDDLTAMRIRLTQAGSKAGEKTVAVHGVAYDSLHGRPLGGAVISALGTRRSTVSDSNGMFVIDSLAPDPYAFVMQHEVLDAIGISAASARMTVSDGRDTVRLFVPSFATIWRGVCRPTPPPPDSGIIFGTVRGVNGQRGQPGATVVGTWVDEVTDSASGFTRQGHFDVTSDSTGGYALCGLPVTMSMRVHAFTDSGGTGIIDLPPLGAERVMRRDLVIGPPPADSLSRGVVMGVVTRDSSRLANARVLTDGVPEVHTGPDGRFVIRDVPTGTRQIEARAIGMLPVTAVVDVTKDDTAHVDIRMGKVTVLDSVRVVALTARQRLVTQFEERRRQGIGRFKDSTEIARSNTLAHVFADLPVTVHTGRGGMLTFEMIGCKTTVYIDRVPELNNWMMASLLPQDIAAIEFYNGGLAPPEFQPKLGALGGGCAIVIWTKRGWP